MRFKIIVIGVLVLSFGALYLTSEPGDFALSDPAAEDRPVAEQGFVTRVIALFRGSEPSQQAAEAPQVLRGGRAMHGGSGGRFVSAPGG